MSKSIHSTAYKLLCTLLIRQRKNKGLSQYDLAAHLKRPQSFIAKIEGGERRIDVIEFLEVANALGADPCEILKAVELSYRISHSDEGV